MSRFLRAAFQAAVLIIAGPASARGQVKVEPSQTFTGQVIEVTDVVRAFSFRRHSRYRVDNEQTQFFDLTRAGAFGDREQPSGFGGHVE